MATFHQTCKQLFFEGKFAELRAYIDKKERSPLFFLVRITALEYYTCACMALDDLPTAARYIDRLRHDGGKGWKYKTAYCYILIKLDEGDLATAHTEFEDFRRDCSHAEIYKTQLEILTAIFTRLLTVRETKPLPAAAVESKYPVVSRILGRFLEEQAEKDCGEWN